MVDASDTPDRPDAATPTKRERKLRPIRQRLLLTVNIPLGIALTALLAFNYYREMDEVLADKHTGLLDEAIAIHQAVSHFLEEGAPQSIQPYIDRVCNRMQEARSPGHHIIVRTPARIYQSPSPAETKSNILAAMETALRNSKRRAVVGRDTLVFGGVNEGAAAVFVSERVENIRRNVREDVFVQLLVLTVLGIAAAVIVNATLLKVLARPVARLAATVDAIAQGEYGSEAEPSDTFELQELAESVNSMSRALARADRTRRSQMRRAREIQEHLLPDDTAIPGLSLARLYHPAADVAGDCCDFLSLPDGTWLICLADVSGHGVPAAMGAAMLKALLLDAVETRTTPDAILQAINHRFVSIFPAGYFATVLLGRWCPETGRLEYINAGHPPPVVCTLGGQTTELTSGGYPVGIQLHATWKTGAVALRPGDVFIVFSDGVTEAADSTGELFGVERLTRSLSSGTRGSADAIVRRIDDALRRHVGAKLFQDDLTLLVFHVDPIPAVVEREIRDHA